MDVSQFSINQLFKNGLFKEPGAERTSFKPFYSHILDMDSMKSHFFEPIPTNESFLYLKAKTVRNKYSICHKLAGYI